MTPVSRRRRPVPTSRRSPANSEITLWRLELLCGHTAFAFPREKGLSYFCYAHGGFQTVVESSPIAGHRDNGGRQPRRRVAAELP